MVDKARGVLAAIEEPGLVEVRQPVRWHGRLCLPCLDGDNVVVARFKTFTFADNHAIETATAQTIEVGEREELSVSEPNEYRRMMLLRSLIWWSLPIAIERENGWMTENCYERIGRCCGALLGSLVHLFYESTVIDNEEEEKIDRQSALLFSEHGRGVTNACEAVSSYCTLSGFWEKFGIDRGMIPGLPFRDYLRLRVMMNKERDAEKSRRKSGGAKKSPTRIAGSGGRIRQSAAKVVAE
jgi:hypothetical protein